MELFKEIGYKNISANSGQDSHDRNQTSSSSHENRAGSPILAEGIQQILESQNKLFNVFNEQNDLINKIANK